MNKMVIVNITVFVFFSILATFSITEAYAVEIFDDDFIIEQFAVGLQNPTTMTFVGNDILVLEKTGDIIRIQENGVLHEEPVLTLPVLQATKQEVGLLGITSTSDHIYLFFTEKRTSECSYPDNLSKCKNVIYQYDWDGKSLINSVLIKEFSVPYAYHNGGVFAVGQNNEIYFVIGDQNERTVYQNVPSEEVFENGSIYKIDTENNNSVELFAMGIRNSFGLAVDPVTGFLWDTENGVGTYDELNLVESKFNSGWIAVQGPVERSNPDLAVILEDKQSEVSTKCLADIAGIIVPNCTLNPKPFEDFRYSDPEFSWYSSVGVTGIEFPDKNSFSKYRNSLFVGDWVYGNIYKFQLNEDRTELNFSNPNLSDLVLDVDDEMDEILFGVVPSLSDIKFHNDAMYIVEFGARSGGEGSIYKIYPKEPLSPLEQYQNGKDHKNIVCKDELMPIMSRTGNVYCVFPKTATYFTNEGSWSTNHPEMPKIELKNQILHELNFEGFNFSYSDLRGSDFTDAKLGEVILIGVNLSGADLSGADLSGADLSGAYIDDNTVLNCTGHPICESIATSFLNDLFK